MYVYITRGNFRIVCFIQDEVNSEELITFDKLLEMIPASAGEISGYLKTIRIMDHDGKL